MGIESVKKVDVLGRIYHVKCYKRNFEKDGRWGDCDCGTAIIRIRVLDDNLLNVDTLIHEIFHAVWYETGSDDTETEEHAVSRLATGITKVFHHNPKLKAFICDTL
jgi:hypothetical protein